MKKLNLSDRETIEIGIVRHNPLAVIGQRLNKSTSSISREIKKHRVFVPGSYYSGNDCKNARLCTERYLCGDKHCNMYCYSCNLDCHQFCSSYVSTKCTKYNQPPYVCNACGNRRYCNEDRYFYDARVAEKAAKDRRKTASSGVHLSSDELASINEILSSGIKKGQPLSHLFAVYESELIISERTAYRLINNGQLDVRNIDLRRQTRYKKRRKKNKEESGILNQQFRQGRSYADYLSYMENRSYSDVVEIDTVKGTKGKGKVLLTMLLRRNSVMLIFIMPNCKAESVI